MRLKKDFRCKERKIRGMKRIIIRRNDEKYSATQLDDVLV